MTDKNELQKAWVRRLMQDYHQINMGHNLGLQFPNFEITSGTRKVGHWNHSGRTLGISSELVENHTWDVTVEVLRHEMGHQYVSEVMKKNNVKAHGQEFQQACNIVGVHPDFRGAGGMIPKFLRPEGEGDTVTSKQLKKIEKLLALASSNNQHEAELAMTRANDLITKYNIEMIKDNSGLDDYDYLHLSTGLKKIPVWTKMIGTILRDHFFVQVVTTSSYDPLTNQDSRAIELIGNKENLGMAEHVYHFLHDRLDPLWKEHQARTGLPNKEKRSYFIGVLRGFKEKMEVSDLEQNKDLLSGTPYRSTGALVVAQDPALKTFFSNRYPNTQIQKTSQRTNIYTGAYNSGVQEGKKVTINKPVSHSDGNLGLQLGM